MQIKWKDYSVRINEDEFKIRNDSEYDFFNQHFKLINHERIFFPCMKSINVFFEDEYVINNLGFKRFLEYYNVKVDKCYSKIYLIDYSDQGLFYKERSGINLYLDEIKSLIKYSSIDEKEKISKISPYIFNELKLPNHLSIYVKELLSLIYLSNNTTIKNNEIKIEFLVGNEENIKFEIEWLKVDQFNGDSTFFDCLNWIFANNIGGLNSNLKKTIVQNQICKYFSFNDIDLKNTMKSIDFIKQLNKTLEIVILDRSKEYFKLQSVLKEDKIEIYRRQVDLTSKLNNGILTLIAIAFSGFFIDIINNNSSFIEIIQNEELVSYILSVLIVGTLIIGRLHYNNLKNYNIFIFDINSLYKETYGGIIDELKCIKFPMGKFILILFILLIILSQYFDFIGYFSNLPK